MISFEFKSRGIFDSFIMAALFCFFIVSVVFVLLSGVNVYRSTSDAMNDRYENRTLLSYITVKIKHYDSTDCISLGHIGDIDALVLIERYGSETYKTYIYCYEGNVCELFIHESVTPMADAGEKIIKADKLEFEIIIPSLVKVIYCGKYGESFTFIHTRSMNLTENNIQQ